jgi:hypothetical protein
MTTTHSNNALRRTTVGFAVGRFGNLSATPAADRAFPATVAELGSLALDAR